MTLRELAERDLKKICEGKDGTYQILEVLADAPANQLIGAAETGRVRVAVSARDRSALNDMIQRVRDRCEIPEGCELPQPRPSGQRGWTCRFTVEYG